MDSPNTEANDLLPEILASKRISRTGDVLAAMLGSRTSFSTAGADQGLLAWLPVAGGSNLNSAAALSSPALLLATQPAQRQSYFEPRGRDAAWMSSSPVKPQNAQSTNKEGLKSPFELAAGESSPVNQNPNQYSTNTRGLFGSPSMPTIATKLFDMSNSLLSPCSISSIPLAGAFPTPPSTRKQTQEATPDKPPPLQRVQDSMPRFLTPDDIKKREMLMDALASSPGNSERDIGDSMPGSCEGTPELSFPSPVASSSRGPPPKEADDVEQRLSKRKSFFGLRSKSRSRPPVPIETRLGNGTNSENASPVSPLAGKSKNVPSTSAILPVAGEENRPRKQSLSHRLSTIFKPKRDKSDAPPTPSLPFVATSLHAVRASISRSQSTPEVSTLVTLATPSRSRPDLILDLGKSRSFLSDQPSPTTPSTREPSLFDPSCVASSPATVPDSGSDRCSGEELDSLFPNCRSSNESDQPKLVVGLSAEVEVLQEAFTLRDQTPTDAEILRSISHSRLGGLLECPESESSDDDQPFAAVAVPRSLSTPILSREAKPMQRSRTTGQLWSPKGANAPNPFAFESTEMSKVPIKLAKTTPSAPRRKLSSQSREFNGHSLLPQGDIAGPSALPLPSFVQDSVLSFDEDSKQSLPINGTGRTAPSSAAIHATISLPNGQSHSLSIQPKSKTLDLLTALSSKIRHEEFKSGASLLLEYPDEGLARPLSANENVYSLYSSSAAPPSLRLVPKEQRAEMQNGFYALPLNKSKSTRRWFTVSPTVDGCTLTMAKSDKDKKQTPVCSLALCDFFKSGQSEILLRSKVDFAVLDRRQNSMHRIGFTATQERDAAFSYLTASLDSSVNRETLSGLSKERTAGVPLSEIGNNAMSPRANSLLGRHKANDRQKIVL